MPSPRKGLHLGSTITRLSGTPWRIVVHWHWGEGDRPPVPAGIEVRCYGVPDDNEDDFYGGQERPQHEEPWLDDGDRSRAAGSDLLSKRIHWGQLIGEHAERLSAMLAKSEVETADMHAGSADLMRAASRSAASLKRASDDTYRLVADLYRQAVNGRARSRPAVYVLERLAEDYGFALSRSNESDRAKVRQWIFKARDLGHLPKTTTNRKG